MRSCQRGTITSGGYGTDANALSKIVPRVSNVENLFRRCRIAGPDGQLPTPGETDQFIRYTQSS